MPLESPSVFVHLHHPSYMFNRWTGSWDARRHYSLEGVQVGSALCSIGHKSSGLIEIFFSRNERVSSYNESRCFTESLRDLLGLVLDVANESTRHGDSKVSCDPVLEWGFGIGST